MPQPPKQPPRQDPFASFVLPAAVRPPRANVGKLLLSGVPKIGKSTLATLLYPDTSIICDCEDSYSGIAARIWLDRAIRNWFEFRALAATLSRTPDHGFDTVVIDTVDALAGICGEQVLPHLAGAKPGDYVHASDLEWGKGWDAIKTEFTLRISALARVVPNIIFVSHLDEKTKKSRTGLEVTTYASALKPKGVKEWLEGFVDHIMVYEVVQGPEGEVRQLRTQPSEQYPGVGGRTPIGVKPLDDPLVLPNDPLESGRVAREALLSLSSAVSAQNANTTEPSGDGIDGPQDGQDASESAPEPKPAAKKRAAKPKAKAAPQQEELAA